MPDPLSSKAAAAAGFTSFIEQYSGTIYTLTCLLLEKGTRADQAATATFAALYEPWLKGGIQSDAFSLAAYRECIRQCSLVAQDCGRCSSALLTWEDQIASALWYGIQLPLPEISLILQRSVPELKAQLRVIREQMAAVRSAVPRPSAG